MKKYVWIAGPMAAVVMVSCTACGLWKHNETVQERPAVAEAERPVSQDEFHDAIYDVTEEENKVAYEESERGTCFLVCPADPLFSEKSYVQLRVPEELLAEGFEMPFYAEDSITVPVRTEDGLEHELEVVVVPDLEKRTAQSFLESNFPPNNDPLHNETVIAPNGTDISYKAVYDKRQADKSWVRTRYGMKTFPIWIGTQDRGVIMMLKLKAASSSMEAEDIEKILDAVDVWNWEYEKASKLVEDYIRENETSTESHDDSQETVMPDEKIGEEAGDAQEETPANSVPENTEDGEERLKRIMEQVTNGF